VTEPDLLEWRTAEFAWTKDGYQLTVALTGGAAFEARQADAVADEIQERVAELLDDALVLYVEGTIAVRSWRLLTARPEDIRNAIEAGVRTGLGNVHEQLLLEENEGQAWLAELRGLSEHAAPTPDAAPVDQVSRTQ
jgi:hypothetical protein